MNFDIKEIISKINFKSSRVPTGREGMIFLYRDWQWLVVSSLVIAIAILIGGFYLFYEVSYGEGQSDTPPASMQSLSREKLQSVIDTYVAKETKFNSIKNAKPSVPNL